MFWTVLAALAGVVAQAPPPILPSSLTGPNFTNQARLALQRSDAEMLIASANGSSARPIPLSRDGSLRFGFALNDFLYSRAEVRQAAEQGRPMSVDGVLQLRRRLIHSAVVAFPLKCSGGDARPVGIELVILAGPRAGPAPAAGDLLTSAADIRSWFSGYDVPEGALARRFAGTLEISEVRVTYDRPACPSGDRVLTFTFHQRSAEADPDGSAIVRLPAEAGQLPWPAKVRVSFFIDEAGLPKFPVFLDGPSILASAAIAHASRLRFEPYRLNSAPVAGSAVIPLIFVGTGAPTARRLIAADLNPPPLGSTADVANLSISRSRCPAGDSPTFGLNEREAIPIGGGAADALRREREYLENLRGPFGQGLFFSQPGVLNGPAGPIHWYNVTYDQLGTFIALFFDPNRAPSGPHRSPTAFTCPAPFPPIK